MTAAMSLGIKRIVFIGHDYANLTFDIGVDYADGKRDVGRHSKKTQPKFEDRIIDIDIQGLGIMNLCRMWGYKFWTDYMTERYAKEGFEFINCTEGGILGAYPEGNLRSIRQCKLSEVNNG